MNQPLSLRIWVVKSSQDSHELYMYLPGERQSDGEALARIGSLCLLIRRCCYRNGDKNVNLGMQNWGKESTLIK